MRRMPSLWRPCPRSLATKVCDYLSIYIYVETVGVWLTARPTAEDTTIVDTVQSPPQSPALPSSAAPASKQNFTARGYSPEILLEVHSPPPFPF
jgi:hypothetical protein